MSVQKLKVLFSKSGDLRFISHLDLMRLFQRASRRAGLPVTITKGFSPHLKLSIMRAMKLGLESQSEEAIFCMDKKTDPAGFISSMNEKLPEGVRIKTVEELS